MQNPLRLPRKTTSQPSKVVRTSGALCILNWKCASRHNSVQLFSTSARQKVVRACSVFNILTRKATTACIFFDISSFKGGLGPSVFDTFDLEMCFAPHRRALFSTSQVPKVFRRWCVLCVTWKCASLRRLNMVSYVFFTWKCASRHNGVHFFDIATSRTAPKLKCFAHFDLEMCFALQRPATFHFSSGQMAPHPAALARLLFDPLEPQIIGKTQ